MKLNHLVHDKNTVLNTINNININVKKQINVIGYKKYVNSFKYKNKVVNFIYPRKSSQIITCDFYKKN